MKLKKFFVIAVVVGATGVLGGCAELPPEREGHEVIEAPPTAPLAATDPVPAPPTAAGPTDDAKVAQMQARIDALTKQLEESQNALALARKGVPQGVIPSAVDLRGAAPIVASIPNDPERGFVQDEAVQLYRKALILFQAGKYPESVLAFSEFLERYPDHALAGSAQYYVGESYFKQKEYKLAHLEFSRVLTSYDRSAHVAHTLRQLAEIEDILKKHEDAARHRQLLTSLFPQSPAAVVKVTAAQAIRQSQADEETKAAASAPGAQSAAPAAAETYPATDPAGIRMEAPPAVDAGAEAQAAAMDEPPVPILLTPPKRAPQSMADVASPEAAPAE